MITITKEKGIWSEVEAEKYCKNNNYTLVVINRKELLVFKK